MGTTKDARLAHSLEHGLGFLHETMSPGDQDLVASYFSSGAIQVCAATACRTPLPAAWHVGPGLFHQDLVASHFSSGAVQARGHRLAQPPAS